MAARLRAVRLPVRQGDEAQEQWCGAKRRSRSQAQFAEVRRRVVGELRSVRLSQRVHTAGMSPGSPARAGPNRRDSAISTHDGRQASRTKRLAKWLLGIVGAAGLIVLGAWLAGTISPPVPSPAQSWLAIDNVWRDHAQRSESGFRIVLCWLENDEKGVDAATVALALASRTKRLAKWLLGIVGTVGLIVLVAWLAGTISPPAPSPAQSWLAINNVWRDHAQRPESGFRIVLC